MKTIKPLRLGILHKTFEHERRATLAVTALLYVPTDRRVLLPEAAMWKSLAEELGDGPLDECMPKPRAEALVDGYAYPSPSGARTGCPTRLALGKIDKTLYAVGDRHWTRLGPSAPTPFERMPLGWRSAFGGEGFADNPVGKGAAPTEVDGQRVHPLPNLENPRDPITAVSSRPVPTSFAAIPVPWPQRFRKAGTYDLQWQRELAPGFARDIDWTFFNMAPEDQQQAAFFAPDEAFTLENMHPDKPRIEGRLPNAVARVFITRVAAERDLIEVPMRIDTVRFFPHLERMVISCRGVIAVAEDDASDVACLLAAVEEPGAPRPLEHYRGVLAARSDKQRAALHGLNDRDLVVEALLPSGNEAKVEDPISAHEELTRQDGLVAKRARKQAEKQLADMRAEMVAAGLAPPPLVLPPEPAPPPAMEDLPKYVDEQLAAAESERKKAVAEQAEAEKKARELCAEQGVDFDAMVEKGRREAAGPPKTTAQGQLDQLEATATLFRNAGAPNVALEAQLASPELRSKLEKMERELRNVYRQFCHHFPAATRLQDAEGRALGAELLACARKGQPVAERDFSGVSLVAVDLRGANLARAWLESANLEGANLEGADLREAVLARANLRGANLVGAQLAGANLGEAQLQGARLDGADLKRAVLAKAQLEEASLVAASLAGADLGEAKLRSADLSRATLPGATFLKVDFSGARVVGADFAKCNFIEVSLVGADFSESSLAGASFVTALATKARFASANMKNVRFVQDSKLDGAVFSGAHCVESNFRGASLEGCDFRKAQLDRSDLSECNLDAARLDLATAVDALFIGTRLRGATLTGTNLMNAILHRAAIEGADFRGANLFRADLARVRGDDATRFDDANMKFARMVERLPPPAPTPSASGGATE